MTKNDMYGIPVEIEKYRPVYEEAQDTNYFVGKNISKSWATILGAITSNRNDNTSNINIALEGGQRIERRYKNMEIAFTYGKKLK